MIKLFAVAFGGALGALMRYGLSSLVHRGVPGMFPWGTLFVNLAGCLAIGFLWDAFERLTIHPEMRTFLFIGVLGAFTTFSTFGLETMALFRDGEIRLALFNVIGSMALGLLMVFAGAVASRLLFSIFK